MLTFALLSFIVYISSVSSQGLKELPQPSCISGRLCNPQACSISACPLFKDAVCVSDRCGCQARFFRWMESEKVFHDVTKACGAASEIKEIQKFVQDAQNDESSDAQAAVTPAMAVKLLKDLNVLTSEALTNIASHLKTNSESNPTEENLKKYSAAIASLRSLQRSARLYTDDAQIEKRFFGAILKAIPTAIKIGKGIYNAVKGNDEIFDLPYDTDAKQLDEDEDMLSDKIEGRFLGALIKGISTGIKVAKGISKVVNAAQGNDQEDTVLPAGKALRAAYAYDQEDTVQARKVSEDSQSVMVMDEDTGEVFEARALPKIPPKVKQGVKEFCKGFRDGLCSDPVSAEDVPARLSAPMIAKAVTSDLKVAADLVSADGQFADVISADPDARSGKSTAYKCGQFVGKLTKAAITAAVAAGCTAAIAG